MKSYLSFETDRLLLRPTSEEDAVLICTLFNTPKWIRYIGDRSVRSVDDAKAYIRDKMRPQLEKLGYSNYTIIRKSDGIKIGTCGLYDRAGVTGIDIGFALLPEYEKKGYAYEAAYKIKDIGITHFGIDRICAITTKENTASQKLLKKLGLTYKNTIKIPNDDEVLLLYELLC